jgi:hypothetical protein
MSKTRRQVMNIISNLVHLNTNEDKGNLFISVCLAELAE